MKLNQLYSVVQGLIKFQKSMKFVLVLMGVLSLNTLLAQCDNPSYGDFIAYTGVESSDHGIGKSIVLGDVRNIENCTFPLFVEWRKGDVEGELLKSGSLEKGKDADIVVLSGDPLNVTTRVEKVILNGKTVYQ